MLYSMPLFFSVSMVMTTAVVKAAEDNEDAYFLLTSKTVDCIVANHETLAESESGIIYVHPPTCPDRPDNPLEVFTTAEAPDIASHLRDGTGTPDRLLILRRRDLDCIKESEFPDNVAIWRFFPDQCQFEPLP